VDLAVEFLILAVLLAAMLWRLIQEYRRRTLTSRRRVVVCLVDDQAITGILWRRHRRKLVAWSASLVQPGREAVAMEACRRAGGAHGTGVGHAGLGRTRVGPALARAVPIRELARCYAVHRTARRWR
jgi:hypothetical protein